MAETIQLTFLGAARNVTGSCCLLEVRGVRILIDCGLFQERDLKSRNWDPFPIPPNTVDAILLTHAHLDHCGRLPKLAADGFRGPVFGTPATTDIARIILLDAAKIQEQDAVSKKERHDREGRRGPFPEIPLYTVEDAQATLPLLTPIPYEQPIPLPAGIAASFHDAGHILGSSILRVAVQINGVEKTLVFSGDLGRRGSPILCDPASPPAADSVVIESTYGNRRHEDPASIPAKLAGIINAACDAGGHVVIPSFAVERAQELLYHLHNLLRENRIPRLTVFLDSPMAIRVTDIFRRHEDLFDRETRAMLARGEHPCDFPGLVICRTAEESKAIRQYKRPAIIIAGSGMCTGGRIKHHLTANLGRPESVILFVGYQAQGTLGRQILERQPVVRIHGLPREVKARVAKINGFSSHADRDELSTWLSSFPRPPARVLINQGEPDAAESFRDSLAGKTAGKILIPEYLQTIVLD